MNSQTTIPAAQVPMTKRNRIAQEIYSCAKEKGWWEKHRGQSELLTLVYTELAEAVEELRANKPPFYYMRDGQTYTPPTMNVLDFAYGVFDETKASEINTVLAKPEGEIIELADAWIRLGDMAGHTATDVDDIISRISVEMGDSRSNPMSVYYDLGSMCFGKTPLPVKIATMMRTIELFASDRDFDLFAAIELKMAYNQTRGYKHGGKKY